MEVKIDEEKDIKITLIDGDKIVAKATCYFENTPEVDGKNIGCIGDFECDNKEYGMQILKKCEEILKNKNIELIVAPMNGNTWKKYRTLKYTNGENPFLLENVNPIKDNEILLNAGFEEMYTYTSTKGKIEDAYNSKVLKDLENKLKENNIEIRKFNKNDYINDFKKIYNISKVSFYRNPFYTPIDEGEFIKQYEQYINLVDEDLILIAEKEGKEIGFIFCIPNLNELKEQKEVKTVIVKTVAVLSEYEKFAIGNILLSQIAENAKSKNFKEWIFAFMYSNNTSQKIAKRNKTELIREYAIYGKRI